MQEVRHQRITAPDAGGHVRAADCRATRWWIRLEGHYGPRMSREDAQALRRELAARLPRSPRSM